MNDHELERKSNNAFRSLYEQSQGQVSNPTRLHLITRIIVLLLSIVLPGIGMFLTIIWKDDRPQDYKWSLFGTIIGVVAYIIWFVYSIYV